MIKIIDKVMITAYLLSGEILVGKFAEIDGLDCGKCLVIWQDEKNNKSTHIPFEKLKYFEKEYVYKE